MKLGMDEIEYIKLIENMTKARVKDCLVGEDELVVVVNEGDMGLAIGRKGEHINAVKQKVGKKISVIEYSQDVNKFIRNLFAPAAIDSIQVNDTTVSLKPREPKRIIGRGGQRLQRAKTLLERHFGIKEVLVEQG